MRVMVIVKATKESEAGILPSRELLTEMGKFNEELVKAGIMLAGEGLQDSAKGVRVKFSTGDRWPVRRNQRTDCRLLDVEGEVDGRGCCVAEAGAVSEWG
jgi:hypothetical protein